MISPRSCLPRRAHLIKFALNIFDVALAASIGTFAANLFFQPVAQPINRLDHIKGFVGLLEFSAQSLDMTAERF